MSGSEGHDIKASGYNASDHGVAEMDIDNKNDADGNSRASHGYRDSRTRIERLLNYKRYIDWMIEQELQNVDRQRKAGQDASGSISDTNGR